MKTLRIGTALLGVVCLLAVQNEADETEPVPPTTATLTISLEAMVRKFSGTGPVKAISIGSQKNAAYVAAICDDSNQLHVFSGSRGKWKRLLIKLETKQAPRILLNDMDGDGVSEVLVCSENLQIFKASNEGFSVIWTSPESFDDKPAPQLRVADLNGDSRKDIIVLNYKNNKEDQFKNTRSLYIYHQQNRDELSFDLASSTTLTDRHGFHSTSGIAIGNLFGNANPEIVVGNDNGFLWLVASNNGDLTIQKEWEIPSGGAIGPGLATGNLDDDMTSELLVGTNGGEIFVFKFTDDAEPTVLATVHAGRLSYGVNAGDVDGDGQDEFILSRGSLGYASMTQKDVVAEVWKLKAGQLERVWQQQTVGIPYPRLLVHDIDEDGFVDLIVYSADGEGKQVEVLTPRELRPAAGAVPGSSAK